MLPGRLPISTNEMRAAHGAQMLPGITDMFLLAQRGFLDFGFIGGAQIDQYGNINTSVIGRLRAAARSACPARGGANDIISLCREVLILTAHEKRRFVERVDFVTSPGHLAAATAGAKAGLVSGAAHRRHRPGPARLRAGEQADALARPAAGRHRRRTSVPTPASSCSSIRRCTSWSRRQRPTWRSCGSWTPVPRRRGEEQPMGTIERGRRVGLLVPSSNTVMEPDIWAALPPGATLHTARMYLEDTTPEGESRMLDEHALPAARDLATARPDLIVFGCTSAGALRGNHYDAELCARISELSGVPTRQRDRRGQAGDRRPRRAARRGGHAVRGRAQPPIRASLEADGVEVARIDGLGIADNFEIAGSRRRGSATSPSETLHGLPIDLAFVSCTNFRGLLGPAGAGATPGPPRGHQQPGGHRRGARALDAAPAGRGG